jgi:hypothetical protein
LIRLTLENSRRHVIERNFSRFSEMCCDSSNSKISDRSGMNELVEVQTSRKLSKAFLFPSAILRAEYEADRQRLRGALRRKCPGDPALRKPVTGIAGCCARAASGQVAAAPPSSVMNSRRFTR